MQTKYLAGIKISDITKQEFLDEISKLIEIKSHSYVVTPYSEFIVTAQKDPDFKEVINSADISTADGIGIFLGIKYFSLKGRYWPMVKCLGSLFFKPSYIKSSVKSKLSGSEFIYDVAKLAQEKSYKVFLLGGFDFGEGNTGELTKKKLEELYPGIQIVGTYSGSSKVEEEEEIIKRVNDSNAQILFIAYGPVAQEKWIYRNRYKLNSMVSFCLGGTFDYVAGAKKKVAKKLSDSGLEGVLRPFVSERGNIKLIFRRIKRAWFGIIKFIFTLIKLKK